MKKPTNSIAVAIGIVGILYFLLRLAEVLVPAHTLGAIPAMQNTELGREMLAAMSRTLETTRILGALSSALLGTAQIIGIAVLIEIVDQIRWKVQKDERS